MSGATPVTADARGLLERDGELAELAALLDAARAGHGAAVAVEGPAGIGKTSLLAAARAIAAGRGVQCLSARGGELERAFPFGVVRQLFEARLASAGTDERRSLLEGSAALAAPVLGAGAPSGPDAGGDASFAALHGLYWLTVNLAQRGPLLLLADDLHWADAASLRYLAYLGRRVEELPVLLLTGARPSTSAAQQELMEALTGDAGSRRLAPATLSVTAVSALVRARLGDGAEEEFCRACHRATAGNPFLARTLVGALAEAGVIPAADQADGVAHAARGTLARAVVRGLGRLAPEASALARAVAILGTDAPLRHAARLAGLSERAAAAAADGLTAQEILRSGQPLDFVHPLVRAAVRDQTPPADRALAHRDAARLLAADTGPPEGVAAHLLAAGPAGDGWVVERLRAAGASATARGAPDAAVTYLRRALAEPPGPPERPALLAELGRAEVRAGEPEPGIAHLRQALADTTDARVRGRIAHDLAVGLIAPGHYVEAVTMLERAIDDVAGLDRELALGLEAELLTAARLDHETTPVRLARSARADRALAGATRGERMLLAPLCFEVLLGGGTAAESSALALRALDRGLLRDVGADSGLWIDVVYALIVSDELDVAQRALAAAFADVRTRGSVIGYARNSCFRALLALRQGRVADAESDARQCIQAGLEPGYRVARMAYAPLVDALVQRGELAAAQAALEEAGMDGEIPDTFMLNFVLHSRGVLRMAQDRPADAVTDLEDLGRREHDWRAGNPATFPYRSDLALALLRLGDAERARALAGEELALARRWGTRRAVGVSLRSLGLAEAQRGEPAIERLRESVAVLDGSGARLEHARSLVELGAALRRAGRRTEARDPLRAGLEHAHVSGATALAARALEELVASGARPRRVMRSGVDALTASERRVARMAAGGLTNREIAQALFVTMRTVEVHLTHAYQKLDIASRDQLAAALGG